MNTPLLDFLEGRAKEALPFLRGAAARGLTPSQAIAELKPLNLTFQRQRMLDVYAALQNRIDPERIARLVGEDIPLPQELHNVSPVELGSNYQYVVGAFDDTGEPLGFVTVSSAVPLAPTAIRALAGGVFASDKELYLDEPQIPIAAIAIGEANVSPGAPLL